MYSVTDYLIVVIVFFLGAFIQGIIGFGFNLLTVPMLTVLAGPRTAVTVVSIPSLIISLIPAAERYFNKAQHIPLQLNMLAPLLLFGAAGTLAGTALLVVLDPAVILTSLGTILLLYVLTDGLRKKWHPQPRTVTPLGILMGSITGIINGLAGISGPLIVPYLHALRLERDRFVYYLNFSLVFFGMFRWISFYSLGLFTPERVIAGIVLIPVSIIGLKLGELVRPRISTAMFSRFVLLVLLITGLDLLRRGLRLF